MQKGDTKLFNNKENLYLMLNLRRIGWGITSLALYFDCDHTSISDQCNRYGIQPLFPVITFQHLTEKIIDRYEAQKNDDHINRGKSYKEYLIEAGYDYQKVKKRPYDYFHPTRPQSHTTDYGYQQ